MPLHPTHVASWCVRAPAIAWDAPRDVTGGTTPRWTTLRARRARKRRGTLTRARTAGLTDAIVPGPSRYSVVVAKDYLKFAAAHFIAYPGFREPLHGHNYQVSVRVEADLGTDGYVLDFGVVKRLAKALCDELDERTIVPARSDCLDVRAGDDVVEMTTAAGDRFVLPRQDCAVLPIVHSSAEELAAYLLGRLREALAAEAGGRALAAIEVGVAEAPGQIAYCREAF